MKAFSPEWCKELRDRMAKDTLYQKKAKGFDSTYQIVVKADPENGIPTSYSFGYSLPDLKQMWVGEQRESNYTMTAPYEVFYQICQGKLDPLVAIASKKARMKGSYLRLLSFSAATRRLIELMREIPTQFEGVYSD